MKYSIVPTHIDQIRVGDVVEIDGILKTVGKNNLKHGGFCGTTLWGDSYKSGTVLVRKAVIHTACNQLQKEVYEAV